jgi:hypothetical protein
MVTQGQPQQCREIEKTGKKSECREIDQKGKKSECVRQFASLFFTIFGLFWLAVLLMLVIVTITVMSGNISPVNNALSGGDCGETSQKQKAWFFAHDIYPEPIDRTCLAYSVSTTSIVTSLRPQMEYDSQSGVKRLTLSGSVPIDLHNSYNMPVLFSATDSPITYTSSSGNAVGIATTGCAPTAAAGGCALEANGWSTQQIAFRADLPAHDATNFNREMRESGRTALHLATDVRANATIGLNHQLFLLPQVLRRHLVVTGVFRLDCDVGIGWKNVFGILPAPSSANVECRVSALEIDAGEVIRSGITVGVISALGVLVSLLYFCSPWCCGCCCRRWRRQDQHEGGSSTRKAGADIGESSWCKSTFSDEIVLQDSLRNSFGRTDMSSSGKATPIVVAGRSPACMV